jgi:glycosidase
MPADPPEIVKGVAGSFYAVRDYADVCPDYAVDPSKRMVEFEALIKRFHKANIKVIIDLVPNHVSRNYSSSHPDMMFGANDDQSHFFDPANNFFYLTDPPGQRLTLPRAGHWRPSGVTFTDAFLKEDGSKGRTPRVTGNNVALATPPESAWFETIKLNWGFDFSTENKQYHPTPRTWIMMDRVLKYWQEKGVDGFRCDFAHYVPPEAWSYLISQARQRDKEAMFIAEAYPENNWGEPVKDWEQLMDAGFDGIYFYRAYNRIKDIYNSRGSLDSYAKEMSSIPTHRRQHAITYLGNHDEVRVAASIEKGGFGSPEAGYQLAPLQFLYGHGPVLFFNGDEVGEPAGGDAGFADDNGRTTIFDYRSMPTFNRWVNAHKYDGEKLTESQKKLRHFYTGLLALCQDDAVRADGYWGLLDHNQKSKFVDCPNGLYTFARFRPYGGRLMLIAANFEVGVRAEGRARLTRELADAAGLSPSGLYTVRLALDESGLRKPDDSSIVAMLTRDALVNEGVPIDIPEQRSAVYIVD